MGIARRAQVTPGTVAHFAQSSAPSGWVKANGANLNRLDYAALFAAWGTTHGLGDGAYETRLPQNLIKDSEDLSTASWVATGACVAGVASLSLASTGNVYAGDHGAVRGLAGAAVSIAMEMQQVSAGGVVNLLNTQGSGFGFWAIDLSMLSTEYEIVTAAHPAVTVNYPFILTPSGVGGPYFARASGADPLLLNVRKVRFQVSATLLDYVQTGAAWVGTLATFGTPDLRGEFIRCLDDSRGIDSGRALASAQAAEVVSHRHQLRGGGGAIGSMSSGGYANAMGANTSSGMADYSNGSENIIGATGGAETRPRNVALLACIKY